MIINIAKDYTDEPGARYYIQGPHPGEEFRNKLLYPKFKECYQRKEKLTVNLDGGFGYGSSFLEESFGGLVRKLKKHNEEYKDVIEFIEIISNDELAWIEKIKGYMKSAIKKDLSDVDMNNNEL